MRFTKLSGEPIPVLGQGHLADRRPSRAASPGIAALQLGIDLGLTLIDTAEMYGDGASEELVAERAISRRSTVPFRRRRKSARSR